MLNPMLDALTSMARLSPLSPISPLSPWDAVPFNFGLSLPGPAPEGQASTKIKKSNFSSDRFSAEAGALRYKLFVPGDYDSADAPLPLVVMLHGYGQDADDFSRGTGMNALAEQHGFLVAYPEHANSASGAGCWNWFERAHHHRGRGEPALIAGVAAKIMSEYAVDAGKVFVAGLSSGGAMAVIVGRNYPDLFCAVGCHSGLAHGAALDGFGAMQAMLHGARAGAHDAGQAAGAVPTIVFHGDLDSTVHPKNGSHVVEQTLRAGAGVIASQEMGEAAGRIFTRDIYRARSGAVVAEQWTVHGAGHAWSGGSRRGSHTDATGPDASEEMLRFFLQSASP